MPSHLLLPRRHPVLSARPPTPPVDHRPILPNSSPVQPGAAEQVRRHARVGARERPSSEAECKGIADYQHLVGSRCAGFDDAVGITAEEGVSVKVRREGGCVAGQVDRGR